MAKDAKYDDTNRGVLFKNDRKEGDRDPDYTGQINVAGAGFWLSAWINTAEKTGRKFMSLSVRSKDLSNDRAKPKQKTDQSDEVFGIGN
jgi:hypothetical protein